MGAAYSFLEAEKKTWIEHTLVFDREVRKANLQFLNYFENDKNLYLCTEQSGWGGISFKHWFITDGVHYLEFGAANVNIYQARVNINTLVRENQIVNETKMSDDIRDRMRHVLGMSNYSLCMRNCEQVANYVYRGKWISGQMDEDRGILMGIFKHNLLGTQKRMVNSFPASIRPHVFSNAECRQVYSFMDNHFTVTGFDYYLDTAEDTHNILVVGPTGAGKSHLINVMFNQRICQSEVSHRSVTREIYFVRGRGSIFDFNLNTYIQKPVVVADTVGLCDTEWDAQDIINMIKGRVSSNFKYIDAVVVVFRADRLLQEYVKNIRKILDWLGYNKWLSNRDVRFVFIGTYADYLDEDKKDQLRHEAIDMFGLTPTERTLVINEQPVQSLVYTGFPPEEYLNDLSRSKLMTSWQQAYTLMTNPGRSKRIVVDGSCTIL